VSDVDGALEKGDLKFTLDGYKLKGSWVLVRTSGRYAGGAGAGSPGPSRSWLLIKHRDEWSSGELDITEFAPRSVKSDGDFEDILGADTPDLWLSGKPSKGGAASTMLASVIERATAQKAARAAPAKSRRASPANAKRRTTPTSRSTKKNPRK
jgi:bifunctional non-homologous end joining protein LigD